MLKIENLTVEIDNQVILDNINLSISPGEIHVIMGPNGSGKSSLASLIAGNPQYTITNGSIKYQNEDISELSPEGRANKGIFLAFQNPIEIPGINNSYFIRTALNSKQEYNQKQKISASEFLQLLEKESNKMEMEKKLLQRQVNVGFSGGEKKKNEILQMAMLKPQLAILDEIDSGLDIDALKDIGKALKRLHSKDNAFLIITHYPRIFQYITPNYVHILIGKKIQKSGNINILKDIEKEGYKWTL